MANQPWQWGVGVWWWPPSHQSTAEQNHVAVLITAGGGWRRGGGGGLHSSELAKELSDAFAAVGGLRRLGSMCSTNLWRRLAAVLVLGDGKTPFTAAACAVSGPPSWSPIVSIDPRMDWQRPKQQGPAAAAAAAAVPAAADGGSSGGGGGGGSGLAALLEPWGLRMHTFEAWR